MDTHLNNHPSKFHFHQRHGFSGITSSKYNVNGEKPKFENYHTQAQRCFENGENLKTQLYCGKLRKVAVKTCPRVLRPNNSVHQNGEFDGNVKKMILPSEHDFKSGKSFVVRRGRIGCARQMFEKKYEREMSMKFHKDCNSGAMKKTNVGHEQNFAIDVVEEKRQALSLFKKVYNLVKKQEAKPSKRIDLVAWDVLKGSGKLLMMENNFGPIPGVDVEDRFDFRVELIIMGIHSQLIHGIDYKKMPKGKLLATSIVATEGYGDLMTKPDELIYTGEGGGLEANGKGVKDQELKGGNLALKNSMEAGNYVRVVRGIKCSKSITTSFVYDGLYKVVDLYKERGVNGKMQFKFKLERCSGQKAIAWVKYK